MRYLFLKIRAIIACFNAVGSISVEREKLMMQERKGRITGSVSLRRQDRMGPNTQVGHCLWLGAWTVHP